VVRVTGNFTSEAPLHPAAREALLAAFDQGWADPKKLSQSSSRAAILRNQSLENIASKLGVRTDTIEVLGEPHLGHYFSIAGLLKPDSTFAYSSIDKGKIRAIARAHQGSVVEMGADANGTIDFTTHASAESVISLQLANGETGVIQDLASLDLGSALIAVDATAVGSRFPLPSKWDTAIFDAQSWMGPSGLAILAINNSTNYHYPLPRIAPIKSPGSFSLPLLIAASIALENFAIEDSHIRMYALSKFSEISGCHIVAPSSRALPHLFSVTIDGIAAENAVRALAERSINVDSGSACSPEDLQPSHVLAAMGYETTGHLRCALHQGTTEKDVDFLVRNVKEVVQQLRS
jgi:cysteine desulfurase